MRVIYYTTALKRIASKLSIEEAAWRLDITQTTYRNQMNGDYQLASRTYGYLKKVRALYEETTGREEDAIDFYGLILCSRATTDALSDLDKREDAIARREAAAAKSEDRAMNAVLVATQTTSMLEKMCEADLKPTREAVQRCRQQVERLQESLGSTDERKGPRRLSHANGKAA